MFRLFKIGKVSFLITFVFVLTNAFNFATSGLFESYLSSGALDFFAGSSYWKAITYLFLQPDIGSMFLTLFTFMLVSPFLENLLSSKYFAKLIFVFSIFQGIAVPLFFFLTKQYDVNISGADGLAIFVITLFSLLNPGYSVSLGRFKIKTGLLTVTTIMTWLLVKVPAIMIGDWSVLLPVLAFTCLGFIAGVASYIVLKEDEKKENIKIDFDELDILLPKAEELKPALISKEMHHAKEYDNDSYSIEFTNNPSEDEESLNMILDKINDYGKESLSREELNFLEEYSTHL